ncbi:MAG: type III secretion system ATPase SctN [Candidatus Oxydemutatoraceae bacterium WSBS_2016_MAG_OTU14]
MGINPPSLKTNLSKTPVSIDYILSSLEYSVRSADLIRLHGYVVEVTGAMIRAIVPKAKVGELCYLKNPKEGQTMLAEVVGFENNLTLLTPMGSMVGISNATEVVASGTSHTIPVGPQLLGKVLDGLGNLLDGGKLNHTTTYPVYADPPNPMQRKVIDEPLPLGLRVLDGLLTCGEGQRLGIFAAAGGGKSTLLSMLIRNSAADIKILALIGERGREVREFIENDIGEEGLKQAVIVVATSDRPATERMKAAYVATAVAEYFRDQGKKVLLMMDSVTRFARAQREIGLAAGEPPTRRGFPPSVFAALPKLMERSGQSDKGSITALYTVLVEGDDMTEPVADETRSILDGHIILSRKLAQANHYPAIDVLSSLSRVMNSIASDEHKRVAGRFRELLAKYSDIEMLVKIGEYKQGADPVADEAMSKIEKLNGFLKQGMYEQSSFEETLEQMKEIVDG